MMHSEQSLESTGETLRWLVAEGVLVAGIWLFWTGLIVAARTTLAIVARLLEGTGVGIAVPLFRDVWLSDAWWELGTIVILATVAIYVFVRAGTILLERHHRLRTDDGATGSTR